MLSCSLFACGEDPKATSQDEPEIDMMIKMDPPIDWSSCAQWEHDPSGDTLTTYPDDQFTISDPASRTDQVKLS